MPVANEGLLFSSGSERHPGGAEQSHPGEEGEPKAYTLEHFTQNFGGLVQMMFLSNWVTCRVQPFIFQGVTLQILLVLLAGWKKPAVRKVFIEATAPCAPRWKAPASMRNSSHLASEKNTGPMTDPWDWYSYLLYTMKIK